MPFRDGICDSGTGATFRNGRPMRSLSTAETLVPRGTTRRTPATGLPPEILAQSARRLRVLALLYAFVFFMSDPLPGILFSAARARFLASPVQWAPAAISIAVALLVAALTWNQRIAVEGVLTLGLVFEVAGSFGIATAEFLDGSRYTTDAPLSWVAVWMISFTVIVPNPPRRALAAALASASSVPLTVGSVMFADLTPIRMS